MAQVKGQPKEKEPPTSVTSVYLHVVEDVIQNVRTDFQSEGVDENVLNELQALWELKMMQAGAIQGGPPTEAAPAPVPAPAAPAKGVAAPVTPVHDLNVPYEATEEYQTPTVEMLFPPTPQAMTPQVMTPLAMTPQAMTPQVDVMTPILDMPSPALTSSGEPIMFQYLPAGPSDSGAGGNGLDLDTKLGRPSPYMQQPSPWMTKQRGVDVNIDMNAAYEEGQEEDEYGQQPVTKDFFHLSTGKRKREDMTTGSYIQGYNIPQGDGAHQALPSHLDKSYAAEWTSQRSAAKNPDPRLWRQEAIVADARVASLVGETTTSREIPQQDGMDDDYDDGVAEEDYNEPGEEEPQPANDATPKIAKVEPTAGDSEGEPPLNEDDDDDLDDNDQGDEEPQTDHLVLAQFDKVTRSKNKWKCTLKDGIMHLNDRDILFVKATGEFEF
ncbi:transcription initiation factor TFIIA large subunit [Marchantia polymorpha subsp. ruderalis]|uniref:Uncharacterized protein n=4 Tax=Marchantia polymorpha TaxID=3197 RepID=A0AAF6B825_MARPO|nr:hypothetical protein MARPO_0112s0032 [Marchantia polymorpha]BBN08159.1 hypothetical protein Mp_4g09320 [Marchantia polymorpha subsp. ruderalis]|eukprot:PTQ31384.1 hypothetical protein MARPO_0112s0032 [Marchantia polymorpha]